VLSERRVVSAAFYMWVTSVAQRPPYVLAQVSRGPWPGALLCGDRGGLAWRNVGATVNRHEREAPGGIF
jgi:hypothetical protein